MWPTADLVTFTEEIPNEKISFFAQWQYVYVHFKIGVFLLFLL